LNLISNTIMIRVIFRPRA